MDFVEIDCNQFADKFLKKGFTESKRGDEMVFYNKISSHIAIVVYSSCSTGRKMREYGRDAIRVLLKLSLIGVIKHQLFTQFLHLKRLSVLLNYPLLLTGLLKGMKML